MQPLAIISPFQTAFWWRVRKPALSAFILFHLVLCISWLMPILAIQAALWETFLNGYVTFTGLDQDFTMFAPNVRGVNLHIEAVVTYKDGSNRLWQYPRMDRLGIFEKMIKERYRKYGHDNIVRPQFDLLWPDLAHYIARVNNVEPDNPPAMVTVLWYQSEIPPPESGLNQPLPYQTTVKNLVTMPIAPEDLR